MPDGSAAAGHDTRTLTEDFATWGATMFTTGVATVGGWLSPESATVQPMSWKIATVAAPGSWVASPLLRTGVISALTVPGAKRVSSRCELLEPPCQGLGAYSFARLPRTAWRWLPPRKTLPSVSCVLSADEGLTPFE